MLLESNLESQEIKCLVCQKTDSNQTLLNPNDVFGCNCDYSFCRNCFEKYDPIQCSVCRRKNYLPYGDERLTVKEKVVYILLFPVLMGLEAFWLYTVIHVNKFDNILTYILIYYIFVNTYILSAMTFFVHPQISIRYVKHKIRSGFKWGTSMMTVFYLFLFISPDQDLLSGISCATALGFYLSYYIIHKWRKFNSE